jgi:hypothetical protein
MGGSLTIHNRTAITVKVTLENTGIVHCQDVIKPGGKHDYDLARFAYDITVEGADDNILQYKLGSKARTAYNVDAIDGPVHQAVNPVTLGGIKATKSHGKTKEFYITEVQVDEGQWQLILSTGVPPANSPANAGTQINQISVVHVNT